MNSTPEQTSSNFIFSGELNSDWHFTDHREIASRGINILFSATHKGCKYLLKGLKKEYRQSEIHKLQILKEYRLGKSLAHEHIVQTYALVEDAVAGQCIVMEYIEGGNLKQWLNDKPSAAMRNKVFLELLDALEYCHAQRVTHCDIKPSNIMITSKGSHVKLIDFGLSDNDSYLIFKQSGGTLGYMAPEQQCDTFVADAQTDIYALGCLMKELFPQRYHLLRRHCKRHNPKQRPQDIGQLRRAYLMWRRLPWVLVATALVGLGLALWLTHRPEPQPEIVETQVVVHDTIAVQSDSTAVVPQEQEIEDSRPIDYTQQLSEALNKVYTTEIAQCTHNESYTYDIGSEIRRRCAMATNNICAQAPQEQHALIRSKAASLQQQLDAQHSSQLHECRIAIALRNR